MGWELPGILRFLPSPTIVPRQEIKQTLEMLAPDARIIDVGAGGRRLSERVTTLDLIPTPGIDMVGDLLEVPLRDDSVDCVVCTGTLEHVRDPGRAMREIHRILSPGGVVHIDVPFIQGYHPDPTDYWRFTIDGLRELCRGFNELAAGVHIGPTCGLVWIMREWADSLFSNKHFSNFLLTGIAFITAPLRWLDYLAIKSPKSHHVASALYFRGTKKPITVGKGLTTF